MKLISEEDYQEILNCLNGIEQRICIMDIEHENGHKRKRMLRSSMTCIAIIERRLKQTVPDDPMVR